MDLFGELMDEDTQFFNCAHEDPKRLPWTSYCQRSSNLKKSRDAD